MTHMARGMALTHKIAWQVHDKELYEVKDRMHKIYAVKRAKHPTHLV